MNQLTYSETLQLLYEQLPMFQRIGPAAFKKDLGNTLALLDALGNPHQKFTSIHIAGTNGKGSVSHMLAGVFQEAGYRTGLYTSPHYRDFRERIKLDGELVSEAFVVEFVERIRPHLDTIKPSFFEITVAMAFTCFAEEKVDIAIVETGLGGRLDSTNVLSPELSVITNIGYDHQQFLGETLPEIAGEKAGIIKGGVPVVIGSTQPDVEAVFLDASKRADASISFADSSWKTMLIGEEPTANVYRVNLDGDVWCDELKLQAKGHYQQQNLLTTLESLRILGDRHPIPKQIIIKGLEQFAKRTRFLGRWQVLGTDPLIIADSAHNREGVRMAVAQLQNTQHRKLHMVWGMVSDKDPLPILELLPVEATYYFVKPEVPRGLDAGELWKQAREAGLQGMAYGTVADGLQAARNAALADDLIYVGGSIFVVAEVV